MKSLAYLLFSLFTSLWLWVSPAVAQDLSPAVANGIEAQLLNLAFDDLPAFEKGGFVLGYREAIFQAEGQDGVARFDDQAAQYSLSYDPAREWLAGQFPSEVIKLGDLMHTGAGIEQLTMDAIGALTGIDIEHFELSDVPFLRDITLGDIVGNVPFLADYSLVDLPQLAERLGALNRDLTLGQFVLENSAIAHIPMADSRLAGLQIADLPN